MKKSDHGNLSFTAHYIDMPYRLVRAADASSGRRLDSAGFSLAGCSKETHTK